MGVAMAVTKQKSASVSHRRSTDARKDERIVRTRIRIDAAFVELLHRRAYGNIRVNDVTKKAGVGRATFYAHYPTKDALLRSQFDRIVAPLLLISPSDPCFVDVSALLEHIRTAPQIYKALTGADAGSAPRVLRDCYEARVRSLLQPKTKGRDSREIRFGLNLGIVARFVSATLITVIECWLQDGAKENPERVQILFNQLVGPGIGSLREVG